MNEREESESVLLYHCPTCGATHLDPVEDTENAALRQQLAEKDKQLSKPRCEHCGSDKLWHGPPECPRCGAPQCCETCCRQVLLEMERDEARQQLAQARAEVERLKAEQEALASVGATAIIRRCELTEQLAAQAAELERLRKELDGAETYGAEMTRNWECVCKNNSGPFAQLLREVHERHFAELSTLQSESAAFEKLASDYQDVIARLDGEIDRLREAAEELVNMVGGNCGWQEVFRMIDGRLRAALTKGGGDARR